MKFFCTYHAEVTESSESFYTSEDSFREFGGAELPAYHGPRKKRFPSTHTQSSLASRSSKSSRSSECFEDSFYSIPPKEIEYKDSHVEADPYSEVEVEEIPPKNFLFYAKVLNAVGKSLKRSITKVDADTIFCVKKPSCLITYIRNLIYTEASPETFIIAIMYLERYLQYNPKSELAQSNAQLLYLTALTVSIKYNDDSYFNSAYYAEIGGLDSVKILNKLELNFLFGINFDLGVDSWEYKQLEDKLLGSRPMPSRRLKRTSKSGKFSSHRNSPRQQYYY